MKHVERMFWVSHLPPNSSYRLHWLYNKFSDRSHKKTENFPLSRLHNQAMFQEADKAHQARLKCDICYTIVEKFKDIIHMKCLESFWLDFFYNFLIITRQSFYIFLRRYSYHLWMIPKYDLISDPIKYKKLSTRAVWK